MLNNFNQMDYTDESKETVNYNQVFQNMKVELWEMIIL